MRTIDEAIKHWEDVAEAEERKARLYQRPDIGVKGSGKRYLSCLECAKEHRQLAEWLQELKEYKKRQPKINETWWKLCRYEEGIEVVKERIHNYRLTGDDDLAWGMQQALNVLEAVQNRVEEEDD